MIVLHYTGMPDVGRRDRALCCSAGTDVSAHYIVLEDGRIVQTRAGSQAGLARRRRFLGRRRGHQFLLDRHRDHQSRS
jgi:N-acetyl-anhydromuramyl-L-alanine amidase AmpD